MNIIGQFWTLVYPSGRRVSWFFAEPLGQREVLRHEQLIKEVRRATS